MPLHTTDHGHAPFTVNMKEKVYSGMGVQCVYIKVEKKSKTQSLC